MITLEKLMTELKAESLNEIVAGGRHNGKGKGWGKGGNPNKGDTGGTGTTGTTGTGATVSTMSTMSESES